MKQATTMSITRALATIKATKAEIEKNVMTAPAFIGIQIGDVDDEIEGKKAVFQSNFDKAKGRIEKIETLKKAINTSNNNVYVTVNMQTMTVADALIVKTQVTYKKNFLAQLMKSVKSNNDEMVKLNAAFETRVKNIIEATVDQNASNDDKLTFINATREQQMKITGPRVMDNMGIVDYIKELTEEIEFLELELDYVLSESNTMTHITAEI